MTADWGIITEKCGLIKFKKKPKSSYLAKDGAKTATPMPLTNWLHLIYA